ncbi:MAG: RidA family protein [Chloroflexota bacterium]|nr:RidA family protein [Chloroflexota bacterium]
MNQPSPNTGNEIVNPSNIRPPIGFSHAVKCHGTMVFVSGATAADADGAIRTPNDMVKQYEDALTYIAAVLEASGATMQDVVKLTYFVIDRDAYVANLKPIGQVYRSFFGKHYPAQSLFGVTALYEKDALLEIEAIACIPDRPA